ncbi:MAG: DUF1932 domain-containing protein [Gammaproteobacteria bacterium]
MGFGEAAQAFVSAGTWPGTACTFDLKLLPEHHDSVKQAECAELGVRGVLSASALAASSEYILSLVTADQSLVAAQSVAKRLRPGALFLDMNSVSPARKNAAAKVIDAAGGRYVDVAIMAPVYPAQRAVPLMISGAHARAASECLDHLGFTNLCIVGAKVGQASAIKMLRSVMVKGIEALTAECLLGAHQAGITSEVLGALGGDMAEHANYRLERMLQHGTRRAAEIDEVCETLTALGVEPVMSTATAARQRRLGALGPEPIPGTLPDKLTIINDALAMSPS